MAGPAYKDDEEEKPLDPAVENVRRKMIRFFIINIGILGIALMAVLAAIVYKATRSNDTETALPAGMAVPGGDGGEGPSITLLPGETALSHAQSGNMISVLVQDQAGNRAIVLFDLGEGRTVGRIPVTAR